jgi:hypothetical protein
MDLLTGFLMNTQKFDCFVSFDGTLTFYQLQKNPSRGKRAVVIRACKATSHDALRLFLDEVVFSLIQSNPTDPSLKIHSTFETVHKPFKTQTITIPNYILDYKSRPITLSLSQRFDSDGTALLHCFGTT